jgi:hypothetical protein
VSPALCPCALIVEDEILIELDLKEEIRAVGFNVCDMAPMPAKPSHWQCRTPWSGNSGRS